MHSSREDLVLGHDVIDRRAFVTFEDFWLDQDFIWEELLCGEIEFGVTVNKVPTVEANTLAAALYFGLNELSTEVIMDDEGGDDAVAARWIEWGPVPLVHAIARIESPARANRFE